MFKKIISKLTAKFRKTECTNCEYNGGHTCLNSLTGYAECCNKSFVTKLKFWR